MGLFAQIEAFLLTFLVGMVAGLIFHYYQSTIHNLRLGRYVLYLMDLILWIIMIIVIAAALFLINQGEIRLYVFLGLVAGGTFYYKSIAPHTRKPMLQGGRVTASAFQTVFGFLAKPPKIFGIWLWTQSRKFKPPPPPDDSDIADD